MTPTLLTRSVLATLREVDERAHSILHHHSKTLPPLLLPPLTPHPPVTPDASSCVSQMPVVLIPIDFSYQPDLRPPHSSFKRSVVLRPFMTSDFMTGVPAVPGKDLSLEVSSRERCHLQITCGKFIHRMCCCSFYSGTSDSELPQAVKTSLFNDCIVFNTVLCLYKENLRIMGNCCPNTFIIWMFHCT